MPGTARNKKRQLLFLSFPISELAASLWVMYMIAQRASLSLSKPIILLHRWPWEL